MTNSVDIRYRADTSQSVLATDKLLARVAKLEGQLATATSKSAKQNDMYGKSWDAVSSRVAHFSRAVKSATNLRDFLSATESLQKARKEFELINARVDEFTAKVVAVASKPVFDIRSLAGMRELRDTLKESASIQFGDKFNKTAAQIRAINAEITKMESLFGNVQSKPLMPAVNLNSVEALRQQLKYIRSEMNNTGSLAQWDILNSKAIAIEKRLSGIQEKAKGSRDALSEAATAPVGSWKRLDYELEKAKKDLTLLTFGTEQFLKQQSKVALLQKDWDKVHAAINKTNKSTKEGGGFVETMAGQVGAMVTSYISLQAVVGQITSEWQHQRDLIVDIANRATEVERTGHKQAINLGADELMNAKKWARDNQRSVMATQEGMLEVYGYSRSSGADTETAKKDALDALRLSLGDAELAKERVLGGQSAQRMAPGSSFRGATGVMMSAASATQGTDEIEFIVNSMRKLSTLTTGTRNLDPLSLEKGLEMITTLTRVNTDVTGEVAAGDLERMFIRMSDFAPQREKKGKDGKINRVSDKAIDEYMGSRDFADRMKILQRPGNEGLMNQFIDSARAGSPRTSFDKILNSPKWKKEFAISEERVIPIEQGEAYFEKHGKAVKEAFPTLVAEQRAKSNYQFSQTEPHEVTMATARRSWDSLWRDGKDTKAPDYTGNDIIARTEAWIQQLGRYGDARLQGMPADQADVYSKIETAKAIADVERKVGNDKTARAVDAQIAVLEGVLEQLKELNAQVAAGKNNPAPAPRPVAPVAQAPPVPRMPAMNLNARGGDVFGWFKK